MGTVKEMNGAMINRKGSKTFSTENPEVMITSNSLGICEIMMTTPKTQKEVTNCGIISLKK
jgi:hypothetical protein